MGVIPIPKMAFIFPLSCILAFIFPILIKYFPKCEGKAARLIKRDYKNREEGCVTQMLNDLDLPSLQQRREFNKLVFLFKIARGMVQAINPRDYLTSKKPKRRIKAKQFTDYQCSKLVDINVTNNSRCFVVETSRTAQFRHSFFVDSISKWNHLPDSIVHAETVESFKAALHTLATRFTLSLPG